MLEINIEKRIEVKDIKPILARALQMPEQNILDEMDYWGLKDFAGFLGLAILHEEGDYQTFAVVERNAEFDENYRRLGFSLARRLDCKVAIGDPQITKQEDSGRLTIFHPNGQVSLGWGESVDGGFVVTQLEDDT
ncbi:hypothetical protein AAFO92_01270 [Roseovarius sp. CAU 1744]|uniref:hypothetical protein n=1 Tax=Roseovarius sp. CAU 1744 TaxID=3140368 RepID=UPI00325A6909